jgi:hypothetical protein
MTLRNGCAYDGEHERKEEKENEKEKKTKQTSGLHIATCK